MDVPSAGQLLDIIFKTRPLLGTRRNSKFLPGIYSVPMLHCVIYKIYNIYLFIIINYYLLNTNSLTNN
jgi:hypothetical protein